METKTIVETTLTLLKNQIELLMHGSIEASNEKIKKIYRDALVKSLESQEEIFKAMEQKGWYKIETVAENKITKVKNKYTAN